MMRNIFSMFSLTFPRVIAYMLQASEYDTYAYVKWLWRTSNFHTVMYRRQLDTTQKARLIVWCLYCGIGLQVILGLWLTWWSMREQEPYLYFGLAIIVAAPLLWAHLIVVPIWFAWVTVIRGRDAKYLKSAQEIFSAFQGPKIAVAGSYGKTTVKEILSTVLAEGLNVAATPANKNVLISHARFAKQLTGNEEVIIIEYGEGKPGDVARFAAYTQPTHAVITGVAPAHLDAYKTVAAAEADIMSVATTVPRKHVYINTESDYIAAAHKKAYIPYNRHAAGSWDVKDVEVSLTGMTFTAQKGARKLTLTTQLLGEHLLGPLALAIEIADTLGLTDTQITSGIAKIVPYEHRMQPYTLNGAYIIDDSYNGNIEGIRAGTALLKTLPATRKIYVTPGLVEQGQEAHKIHVQMGTLIAQARPDMVVLMDNSAAKHIQEGLRASNYKGEVRVEDAPLEFYANLDSFVAAGDVVLLQNDWTDNYA